MYELQIRLALIRHKGGILTSQAGVVLDCIVQAEFLEIEAVGPIRAVEKIGGEFGYEEAK